MEGKNSFLVGFRDDFLLRRSVGIIHSSGDDPVVMTEQSDQ